MNTDERSRIYEIFRKALFDCEAPSHCQPPPDPNSEIRFKAGCALMGFSSKKEYQAKRKAQRGRTERGEENLAPTPPEPHEKNGAKLFFRWQIDAYNAEKTTKA